MSSSFLNLSHSQQRILRILIILGVLGFSLLVGQFVPARYLAYLLILIIAFGGFLIFIKNPPLGLLAVIAGGLLVGFELGTGTSTSIHIVVILLPLVMGVWFVDRFIRQHIIRFVPSSAHPPLIALVIASLLAFGIGQLTWFYYAHQAPLFSQLGGLAIIILSVVAFIFTANVIDDIKWLKTTTWVFVALGMLTVLSRIVPVFGSVILRFLPDGATGSLFWLWLVSIIFSQLLFNRDLKIFWRLVLLGSVAVTLYIAMYRGYDWKSGWIPAIAAMGIITWFRFRRLRYVLVLGGLILIWLVGSELIQSDQYSYVTRIEAWRIILNEIIRVNPVFGLGPANYRFYTPLFPIMGYWVEFNSHNNYIDLIAQVGVLGLLAFLWFAWEVWMTGWRLHMQNLDGFSIAYVVGAMGGLIGMLVAGMLGDWVLPFVYNVGLSGFRASVLGWIFLGGLVAIERITANKKRQSLQE